MTQDNINSYTSSPLPQQISPKELKKNSALQDQ